MNSPTAHLVTRPLTLADAAAVADLWNAIEASAGGVPAATEAECRVIMSALLTDAEANSRLLATPDGEVVAAAMVQVPPPGGARVDLDGGVHPKWIGQGIGRELLDWQTRRARDLYRDADVEVAWHMEAGAVVGHAPTERLLARYGFEVVRYFMDMHVDLTDDLPLPSPPDGMRMTAYRPDLKDALHEAHMEAFADHWGFQHRPLDMWERLTVCSEDFRPDLSRIALDGDRIAAYVLGYDRRPGEVYIGQVGTRRPWRRRGLASWLLADVLAQARRDGLEKAWLGVDMESPTGAVGVYERIGFVHGVRYAGYRHDM